MLPALAVAAQVTLAGHPLAGRIWDVARARFVAVSTLEEAVAAADVALLGETHDTPVHHELPARLLRMLVERGKQPTLALEQVDTENQPALEAARAAGAESPAALAKAAKVSSSWRWSFYEPLVALALAHRLPIVGVNLSRQRAREGLPEAEAKRLALDDAWSRERGASLRTLLVESHCGDDSPYIDRMVEMQRARDAVMADRMAAAGPPVVAIVGRGHARADLGIPLYLRHRFPKLAVLSLALVEVTATSQEVSQYPEAARGRHDFVWFTPRAVRDDPCAPRSR
jgi:uncharacterized iron-regulated protein